MFTEPIAILRTSTIAIFALHAHNPEQILFTSFISIVNNCFTSYLYNNSKLSKRAKGVIDYFAGGLAFGAAHYCSTALSQTYNIPPEMLKALIHGFIPMCQIGLCADLANKMYTTKKDKSEADESKNKNEKSLMPPEFSTFSTQAIKYLLLSLGYHGTYVDEKLTATLLSSYFLNLIECNPGKDYFHSTLHLSTISRAIASYSANSLGHAALGATIHYSKLTQIYLYSFAYSFGNKAYELTDLVLEKLGESELYSFICRMYNQEKKYFRKFNQQRSLKNKL